MATFGIEIGRGLFLHEIENKKARSSRGNKIKGEEHLLEA